MTAGRSAIGILGGYGSVGQATAAHLRGWAAGPVVTGGRDGSRADAVVDAGDPASVERFCASLRLVINCTAAPPQARAAAARAATASGVPYVDPGGDEPVHDLLSAGASSPGDGSSPDGGLMSDAGSSPGGGSSSDGGLASGGAGAPPVVLSAGLWPGLTSLLPRLLPVEPGGRLCCYVGGQDRFTLGAAADYLAVVNGSAGRTFAVWRDGSRVERAGLPAIEGDVPYFPDAATGVPYLSQEMERLAQHLGLAELVFYTVFPGQRLRETLAATRTDAEAVVRASELDLFGRSRYQRLVFQWYGAADGPAGPIAGPIAGPANGQAAGPATATVVLSGKGSSELTGATVAMTALAVLDGAVPAGLHFAADVLDPAWAKDKLMTADAVTGFRTVQARLTPPMPAGSPRHADPEHADSPEPAEEGAI